MKRSRGYILYPFSVPKFKYYIKRKKILLTNFIHYFDYFHLLLSCIKIQKNGWATSAHPSNKRTRLKVLEGVD